MTRKQTFSADLEGEAEVLKSLIREAHEAMKGLRDLLREVKAETERVRTVAFEVSEEMVVTEVQKGLAELGVSIERAVESSTDAVFKRFDTISATLLGETKEGRKREYTIPELADAYAIAREIHESEEENRNHKRIRR